MNEAEIGGRTLTIDLNTRRFTRRRDQHDPVIVNAHVSERDSATLAARWILASSLPKRSASNAHVLYLFLGGEWEPTLS